MANKSSDAATMRKAVDEGTKIQGTDRKNVP